MALVQDLHDVSRILSEYVSGELGYADVQAGPPRNVNATITPAVRFTLLYTTPQPSHRSDPWIRQADGTERPPPLSLSCFFIVTASGAADDDPIGAHNALGKVLQLFHDLPELSLPLSGATPSSPPSGYSDLGEGPLAVVQVPMALELIDKVWSSLEETLQPWALLEVSPVQLPSLRDDAPPRALVRPGGIELGGLRVRHRPSVTRIVPSPAVPGGRVRVDVQAGAVEALRVAGIEVPATTPSLTQLGDSLLLTLDALGLEALARGGHALVVQSGGMLSERAILRLGEDQAALLEAPAMLRHDPTTPLLLRGTNLGGSVAALAWPDWGVGSPADVYTLTVSAVSADTVTIPAGTPGGLGELPDAGPWRIALRSGAQLYTPYVVLEVGP